MKITVCSSGSFRDVIEQKYPVSAMQTGGLFATELEVGAGTTIADILAMIGLGDDSVGMTLIGGRSAEFSHQVQPGEQITLLPVLVGG